MNLFFLVVHYLCCLLHYVVGIHRLSPNTLTKFQLSLRYIGNSAILNYANRSHDIMNPT